MNAQLYYAVMLITNPQKARRILLAEELEDWFMDLFEDEFVDIMNGTFKDKQEDYIDRIVNRYLLMTDVKMTNTDEYSKSVIDKAFKVASEIQETTWKYLVTLPLNKPQQEITQESDFDIAGLILGGLAVGSFILENENVRQWLGQQRANLIALNEANWKWNNEEYFEAVDENRTKIWHTALDEKVRMTHITMEGVEIPIDEPFHVGSSLMQYPLDTSLGADISEIANCRCSVEYK